MRDFSGARTCDTADELWLLEHPPVFTLGQAGRLEHLLDVGTIPVVHSDRGGQVTYHGPGQLIAYLLLDLRRAESVSDGWLTSWSSPSSTSWRGKVLSPMLVPMRPVSMWRGPRLRLWGFGCGTAAVTTG